MIPVLKPLFVLLGGVACAAFGVGAAGQYGIGAGIVTALFGAGAYALVYATSRLQRNEARTSRRGVQRRNIDANPRARGPPQLRPLHWG